ncbi:trans-aconitate 2-methyltransferase [Endozoicomonas sp. ONNA1]|uniref:class I SAM-dependent methyltransferase n=1 Tax=Endozoicomonas sp. ONNA1 TaxID=2828740 RepID=UPI002148FE3F|nr:class I SAM-dependent methyltransferase [Endozoicomonas sp. ONNA1]
MRITGNIPTRFALIFLLFLSMCSYAESEAVEKPMVPEGDYSLSNKWDMGRRRLEALQQVLDSQSQASLKPYLKAGGHFLEIGPGLGSMSRFLAESAGENGKVIALDIDDHFLAEVAAIAPQIEVIHEDITAYDPGVDRFDLVFIRLVVMHLTKNDNYALIAKLARSLKPGGYLVIEDYVDGGNVNRFREFGKIDAKLPDYVVDAYHRMSKHIDFDQGYLLADMMSKAGLVNVDAEISYKRVQGGDNAHGRLMYLTFSQLEPYLKVIPEHDTLFPLIQAAWMSPDAHWYDHARLVSVGQKAPEIPGQP